MAPEEFSDAYQDNSQLREAIKNILEKMAQSSGEEKKELLNKMIDTINEMNMDDLELILNSQGLEKATNKKEFMELIEKGLENLKPEKITPEIIRDALKSVNNKAVMNSINKGPFDKLTDNFKALSINKKIGVVSAGIAITAVISPFIVLATLIALASIGARYAGIGAKKAGEEIAEGATELGKKATSAAKDFIGKFPMPQKQQNNFDKYCKELTQRINEMVEQNLRSADKGVFDDIMADMSARIAVVKMLQNEEQQSAIRELVKDGVIKDFLTEEMNMERLIKKGYSTFRIDVEPFDKLIDKFHPEIMAIGGGKIEDVKQKVNEKIEQMKKPDPNQLNDPNASQVAGPGQGVGKP